MPRAKGAGSSVCFHEEILQPGHEMHQSRTNRGEKNVDTRCHAPPLEKYKYNITYFTIPCLAVLGIMQELAQSNFVVMCTFS